MGILIPCNQIYLYAVLSTYCDTTPAENTLNALAPSPGFSQSLGASVSLMCASGYSGTPVVTCLSFNDTSGVWSNGFCPRAPDCVRRYTSILSFKWRLMFSCAKCRECSHSGVLQLGARGEHAKRASPDFKFLADDRNDVTSHVWKRLLGHTNRHLRAELAHEWDLVIRLLRMYLKFLYLKFYSYLFYKIIIINAYNIRN